MSAMRFFAIVLIFGAVSVGWWVLGATVHVRTRDLDDSLSAEMASLWGPKVLAQASPYCAPAAGQPRQQPGCVAPAAGTLTADIKHQHRYKGLLWYSTFEVDFRGEYKIAPADAGTGAAAGAFIFPLPRGAATYHALAVALDGNAVVIHPTDISSGKLAVPLKRDVEHVVTVHYVTGGQDAWVYAPGEAPQADCSGETPAVPPAESLTELRDFSLTVTTDFAEIDYPRGTLSPKQRAEPTPAGGMQATWTYPNLITRQCIGIAMPRRQNAGPIASRMSFFAPVSLFFFFTVLFAVVVLKRIALHPMHYLFISAGFFAFHVLMAYLADLVNIHGAFWIAAAVSVFLVVSYMRLVAGVKFALTYAAVAQLVYLVGFSYAFFWRGRTGLTVSIAAVATLFVLMQATGRVNWQEVFRRPHRAASLPPVPSPSPPAAPPPAPAT
jgi:hypothetical protein